MHKAWNIIKRLKVDSGHSASAMEAIIKFGAPLPANPNRNLSSCALPRLQLGGGRMAPRSDRWRARSHLATPPNCGICDMAWLKVGCSLKLSQPNAAKPLVDYLKTPLKNCAHLCPCRAIDNKPLLDPEWSDAKLTMMRQTKPSFSAYLQALIKDSHQNQQEMELEIPQEKPPARVQSLRIHVSPTQSQK